VSAVQSSPVALRVVRLRAGCGHSCGCKLPAGYDPKPTLDHRRPLPLQRLRVSGLILRKHLAGKIPISSLSALVGWRGNILVTPAVGVTGLR